MPEHEDKSEEVGRVVKKLLVFCFKEQIPKEIAAMAMTLIVHDIEKNYGIVIQKMEFTPARGNGEVH